MRVVTSSSQTKSGSHFRRPMCPRVDTPCHPWSRDTSSPMISHTLLLILTLLTLSHFAASTENNVKPSQGTQQHVASGNNDEPSPEPPEDPIAKAAAERVDSCNTLGGYYVSNRLFCLSLVESLVNNRRIRHAGSGLSHRGSPATKFAREWEAHSICARPNTLVVK